MSYDVVVVGAGIGGLTVAALLSARGLKTCLLERQHVVGGCISRVEYSGHDFDPGMGLYTSFGPGEIYERVFSELSVPAPETSLLTSDYVVRLFDGTDVEMKKDESFFDELRKRFPECDDQAIEFYKTVDLMAAELNKRHLKSDGRTGGVAEKLRGFWRDLTGAKAQTREKTALEYSGSTSHRFQTFIDSQLRAFIQTPIERCSWTAACVALSLPRSNLYSMKGGPAALAERLAEAIKQAGNVVRLNSPVLRLAYNEAGNVAGVDLLSGETVRAKRAIVSNLTIWDTYGKLVGLLRTPPEIKRRLAALHSRGAYLIYASVEETAVSRLPAERFLVGGEFGSKDDLEDSFKEFTFAAPPQLHQTAPSGKRAVTLKASSDSDQWFSFQATEEDYEGRDQKALERFWERLHQAVPELGGDIEVLETANPRTFYEATRRKLGMVLGVEQMHAKNQTTLPNVFMVGDTVAASPNLSAVTHGALLLANALTK